MVQSPVQEPVSLPAEAESAPQPARRRVFIWVGSGCLLLIAIPSLLLAGFVAIRLLSPERSALRAQGSAFGAHHVDRACLDAAILGGHGIPQDASDDLRRVFLNACLRKAQRSASFCEGVPAFTAFTKHRAWTREACKLRPAGSRRTCVAVSAALLGSQLWVFLWAPLHGRLLEVSLGYFLLPLIMVLVGRFYYHERLDALQWLAVGCAAVGVAHELWATHAFSWPTLLV